MTIEYARAAVITEAESWIGTPFHHAARVKGAGVDCLMLLCEVYERTGVAGHVEPGFYRPDFMLHRNEERYADGMLAYARAIHGPPDPGDIALFKFGRLYAHAAIVTGWPRLVHAYWAAGAVCRGDATMGALRNRPVKFFSPF
jgi:NlpC/P60 family putative phage cell wall peptidase